MFEADIWRFLDLFWHVPVYRAQQQQLQLHPSGKQCTVKDLPWKRKVWSRIANYFIPSFHVHAYKAPSIEEEAEQANTQDSIEEAAEQANTQDSIDEDDGVYPSTGKGLCVIITNFIGESRNTHHLPGYIKDHKDLNHLFKDVLKYEVITKTSFGELQNLSYRQLRESLKWLQTTIKEKCQERYKGLRYDRFVVFVLSHGGEKGLNTCEEGSSGKEMEFDWNGNAVFVSVEEIINAFAHDNVPELDGIPKCFFLQACRGCSYVMKAAAKEIRKCDDDEDENLEVVRKPTLKRENVMVAYATQEYKYCFVDEQKGSWFVQNIVKIIRERYRSEDIFGIMTRVINATSGERGQICFHCNNPKYEIKVSCGEKYYPISLYGQLPDNKPLPLRVNNGGYLGFAPSWLPNHYLKNYKFLGTIEYLSVEGGSKMPIEKWISAEELKAFADRKKFKIHGKVRSKIGDQETTLDKEIEVLENAFSIDHWEGARGWQERKNMKVLGYVHDLNIFLSEEEMKDKPAEMYMDEHLYSVGKLVKCGVWGMNADVYQLPVIYSTMTRKMFLTAEMPSCSKVGLNRDDHRKAQEDQRMYEISMKAIRDHEEEKRKRSLESGDPDPTMDIESVGTIDSAAPTHSKKMGQFP